MTTVSAPVDWVESVAHLRLPSSWNEKMQDLMDRNNEGQLSEAERKELESLVEWSEEISLVRARALILLGRTAK